MAEADHEFTTRLSLDSPLWLPTEKVHRRLCQLTGERGLAARDMTAAFEGGSIRTLRRWLLRRGRAKSRLTDRRLWGALSSWSDGLYVAYRDSAVARLARLRGVQVRLLKGYVFYAWLPDLAKVWPSIFGPMLPPPAPTGAVAVVEHTIAGTSIVEWPEITGALAVIDDQDDITTAGNAAFEPAIDTVASEPVAGTAASKPSSSTSDSAKRFVDRHPRYSGEKARDYFNRLEGLCGHKYPRKTLRNWYYEIQKEKQ